MKIKVKESTYEEVCALPKMKIKRPKRQSALARAILNLASYGLYADYFWYEIGDMISIGDAKYQYYCFPKDQKNSSVAKARLATEELYKISQSV